MARKKCARPGCRRNVKSPTASYCADPACERARARARRRKADQGARAKRAEPVQTEEQQDTPAGPAGGATFVATLEELTAAGRVHTAAGQQALKIASRIDYSGEDSGSSLAALGKQHLAALAEALRDLQVADDPLDELAVRRAAYAAG
jgi:hypothetical protein